MKVLIARHGLSEANNRENFGSMAFASTEAQLMSLGREQAKDMGVELVVSRGVNIGEPVAVSELLRSQETARLAGFQDTKVYPILNEVTHGLSLPKLREMLNDGELPKQALLHAEDLLKNPPEESIWISHGLVIAGLCKVLRVHQEKRLIPHFCEIRELDLG